MPTVAEIMNTKPVLVPVAFSALETAKQLKQHHTSAAVAVQPGLIGGIVTERDLVRKVLAHPDVPDPATMTVAQVMTPDPRTIAPDTPIEAALEIFIKEGFRHLVVAEGATPVGILSLRDMLRQDLVQDHLFKAAVTSFD